MPVKDGKWMPERKMVAYRLPIELLDVIEAAAQQRGMTNTAVVEAALGEYLDFVCEVCGQIVPAGRSMRLKK